MFHKKLGLPSPLSWKELCREFTARFTWVNPGQRTKAPFQEQDRACLQASRRRATLTLSPARAFSTLSVFLGLDIWRGSFRISFPLRHCFSSSALNFHPLAQPSCVQPFPTPRPSPWWCSRHRGCPNSPPPTCPDTAPFSSSPWVLVPKSSPSSAGNSREGLELASPGPRGGSGRANG